MDKLEQINQFISTLFRPGEHTCFAKRAAGTTIFPVDSVPSWVQYFSINPLFAHYDAEDDAELGKGRRADANVTAFRNFLLECDNMSLEEQLVYMEDYKVPWATCVYSGSKSFHFIISLADGYADHKEYEFVAVWIHNILKKIDHKTKNPSRLSRFPNVLRVDSGNEQKLIEIRKPITRKELADWLAQYIDLMPVVQTESAPVELPPGELGYMSKKSRKFLVHGAEKGERNDRVYRVARDLYQQGWTYEMAAPQILERLKDHHDYNEKEYISTIRQAFKRPPKHPPRLSLSIVSSKYNED